MKKTVLFLGVILGTLVLAAGGGLIWAWLEASPLSDSPTQRFRIPAGEALAQTSQRLHEAGLVRNPLVFRAVYQFTRGDGSFPSGTFLVPGGLTAWEAADFFRSAQPIQIRVTVPEGWTATKIARLLEEKQVVSARDFLEVVRRPALLGDLGEGLTTLDGRLFPDTYLFPLETPAVEVARTFVQTFRSRTAPWAERFTSEEWERRIVLASIVEREYRDPSEAPLIASVFTNRLTRGIPLGSCATIEYILTEIQGRPHPKRIFFVHTEIPSPYNTYLNKGLPPGAIANPGLTALRATLDPTPTDFLYFVVADAAKGTHTFSTNYSRHQKAREAYLNNYVTKG